MAKRRHSDGVELLVAAAEPAAASSNASASTTPSKRRRRRRTPLPPAHARNDEHALWADPFAFAPGANAMADSRSDGDAASVVASATASAAAASASASFAAVAVAAAVPVRDATSAPAVARRLCRVPVRSTRADAINADRDARGLPPAPAARDWWHCAHFDLFVDASERGGGSSATTRVRCRPDEATATALSSRAHERARARAPAPLPVAGWLLPRLQRPRVPDRTCLVVACDRLFAIGGDSDADGASGADAKHDAPARAGVSATDANTTDALVVAPNGTTEYLDFPLTRTSRWQFLRSGGGDSNAADGNPQRFRRPRAVVWRRSADGQSSRAVYVIDSDPRALLPAVVQAAATATAVAMARARPTSYADADIDDGVRPGSSPLAASPAARSSSPTPEPSAESTAPLHSAGVVPLHVHVLDAQTLRWVTPPSADDADALEHDVVERLRAASTEPFAASATPPARAAHTRTNPRRPTRPGASANATARSASSSVTALRLSRAPVVRDAVRRRLIFTTAAPAAAAAAAADADNEDDKCADAAANADDVSRDARVDLRAHTGAHTHPLAAAPATPPTASATVSARQQLQRMACPAPCGVAPCPIRVAVVMACVLQPMAAFALSLEPVLPAADADGDVAADGDGDGDGDGDNSARARRGSRSRGFNARRLRAGADAKTTTAAAAADVAMALTVRVVHGTLYGRDGVQPMRHADTCTCVLPSLPLPLPLSLPLPPLVRARDDAAAPSTVPTVQSTLAPGRWHRFDPLKAIVASPYPRACATA